MSSVLDSGASSISARKPNGHLDAIVEVMLGTSARIGEVLAIRRRDIDVTSQTPSIRITDTIVSHRGETTMATEPPEDREVSLHGRDPIVHHGAVRGRPAHLEDSSRDALLFCSREGTPLNTNNVRRQHLHVMDPAGTSGETAHMFRRTAATAINVQAGVELAAELLGNMDPRITIQHHIRRGEMVNTATAEMLERAFAKDHRTAANRHNCEGSATILIGWVGQPLCA